MAVEHTYRQDPDNPNSFILTTEGEDVVINVPDKFLPYLDRYIAESVAPGISKSLRRKQLAHQRKTERVTADEMHLIDAAREQVAWVVNNVEHYDTHDQMKDAVAAEFAGSIINSEAMYTRYVQTLVDSEILEVDTFEALKEFIADLDPANVLKL